MTAVVSTVAREARDLRTGDFIVNRGAIANVKRAGVFILIEYATARCSVVTGTIDTVMELWIVHIADEVLVEDRKAF